MQRRELLRNVATGIAGIGAGMHLLNRTTENASAAVSLGTLDVTGDELTTDDGQVSAVDATVSGQWQYDLPSGKNPARWEVTLVAASSDSEAAVATTSGEAKYLQNNGEYTVSGDLLQTGAFDAATFQPPEAGTFKEVPLGLSLVFLVLANNDTVLARASITDQATVKVTHRGYQATDYGQVSGSGSVNVS